MVPSNEYQFPSKLHLQPETQGNKVYFKPNNNNVRESLFQSRVICITPSISIKPRRKSFQMIRNLKLLWWERLVNTKHQKLVRFVRLKTETKSSYSSSSSSVGAKINVKGMVLTFWRVVFQGFWSVHGCWISWSGFLTTSSGSWFSGAESSFLKHWIFHFCTRYHHQSVNTKETKLLIPKFHHNSEEAYVLGGLGRGSSERRNVGESRGD